MGTGSTANPEYSSLRTTSGENVALLLPFLLQKDQMKRDLIFFSILTLLKSLSRTIGNATTWYQPNGAASGGT